MKNTDKYNEIEQALVAVFTMGGTITSSFNVDTYTISPSSSEFDIFQFLPGVDRVARVELHEFCNLPGPHITLDIALDLARELQKNLSREDVHGAVVVQGTDTLEEVAYFIELVVNSPKPVVFTGAMKSYRETYVDAPGNLLGAIRIASNPNMRNCGVVVFFNQEIHQAKNVVKAHTSNVSAFCSPGTGPMGTVYNKEFEIFYLPLREKHFKINQIEKNVVLIKAAWDMNDMLLKASIQSGVSGIVIEGFGAGNLPPQVVPSISKTVKQNIPVVIVSRCYAGKTMNIYEYEGGGARLNEIGVISGGSLSGPKARVKLMLVLGCTKNIKEVRSYFEDVL
ncbi:MAG: asparaginase [Clostridiales bacterium]|nr:asparaginase [Clostridiales bacterium]MCF8022290.1 asparaginase [Clostridiales bacterium]